MEMEKEKTCCICGEKFTGWGNNPAPVKDEGQCCDKCNMSVVLSARLFGFKKTDENIEEEW